MWKVLVVTETVRDGEFFDFEEYNFMKIIV